MLSEQGQRILAELEEAGFENVSCIINTVCLVSGDAKELAENLIEEDVDLIDNDGSSRGERHFIIYNPPVTDQTAWLGS